MYSGSKVIGGRDYIAPQTKARTIAGILVVYSANWVMKYTTRTYHLLRLNIRSRDVVRNTA